MKNSLSSPNTRRTDHRFRPVPNIHVALLLVFLLVASSSRTCRCLSNPTTRTTSFSRNNHNHHHQRPCDSFSHEKTRSLCERFHGISPHSNHRPHLISPPPPPPPPPSEIDPRYGVEKRLVPSGPNPLHN